MIAIENIHFKLLSLKEPVPIEVVKREKTKALLRCKEKTFWAHIDTKKFLPDHFWGKLELIDNKLILTLLPFKV